MPCAMNKALTRQLIALNNHFYQTVGVGFNTTRTYAMQGWQQLAEIFTQQDFKPRSVLDMGCGSGVLGLTLAAEQPGWDLTLADISPEALALAEPLLLAELAALQFLKDDVGAQESLPAAEGDQLPG